MGVLSHLEPKPVFDYFEKLCAVPHGSGNTKLISDLCASFARELGLKYRQEDCNNLIIWKDASAGYENAAPVILQGHMDMVCAQTEDCTKDMSREGLDLRTDGTYVWADKTSLGGDDCIAVATALAPALAASTTSRAHPTPPPQITGTSTASVTARISSRSMPRCRPSQSTLVSRISPAPSSTPRLAHSTTSRPEC